MRSPTRASPLHCPVPPPAKPRPGVATALVVDGTGQGHALEVVVEVYPGEGGVSTPQDCERDASVAGQVAVAAVLGASAGAHRVVWQVRGAGFRLYGTSLALAIAVATASAVRGRPVPAGWAFTGGVDLDGRIAPVAGIPAKLRAAGVSGCTHVVVPRGSPAGEVALHRLDADALGDVLARVFPESPWRAFPGRALAAALAPTVAVFVGLGSLVDVHLHYPLLRAAGRAVVIEDVVVVVLPELPDLRSYRPEWPALVDRLAAAGAAAILVDVSFTAETESDVAIAAAIRRAGVPVIVPVRLDGERVDRPGSDTLAEAVQLGHAVSLADLSVGWIRRARVRVADGEGRDYWHVAALAAGALVHAGPPEVTDGELRLGALRNPLSRNSVAMAPSGQVLTIKAEGDLAAVRGRLAIVGALHGDRDLQRSAEGPRYGAEVLASQVQTLLRQAAPRELAPGLAAAWTLAVGVGTTLVGRTLPRAKWPVVGVPAALSVAFAVALATGGTLAPIAGPVVAALLAVWVRRRPTGQYRSLKPGGAPDQPI